MKTTITLLLCFLLFSLAAQNPPPPIKSLKVTLAGKTSGKVTRAEIENTDRLLVLKDDGTPDSILVVSGFKFSVFRKGLSPILDVSVEGDSVTQNMKNFILASQAGSKFYIESLRVRMPGRMDRKEPPLAFELAD